MSVHRAIQSAQRRRPATSDPNMLSRGPQTSINSAQMFGNNGRMGPSQQQHQQMQHQQMQHQQMQQPQQNQGIPSKLTIPQAITLITLRLGAVENKLTQLQESGGLTSQCEIEGSENMALIDKTVIQSITSRLESLEKRSGSNTSGPETNLLKQQVETLKQNIIQTKGALVKENKELKTTINNLSSELTETKELLQALQTLTMDNSQKLMNMSFNLPEDFSDEIYNQSTNDYDNENEVICDNSDGEIIGTNLKELIEKEVNATML
jgi:hypothetical protein